MNKYYILDFEVSNNDYFAEKVDLSNLEIQNLYIEGVSLKDKNFEIILKKKSVKGRTLDVRNMIPNLYGFPIISQPIADVLLDHCPKEIELFEVKVNMSKKSKYYFLNILTRIDNCIDLKKSVYEFIMPERPDILIFKYLEKLVLDTEKINQDIFRIHSFATIIIVSELLKKKIEALGMKEIVFLPTEKYQQDMFMKKT
jgi:hypothetical protein